MSEPDDWGDNGGIDFDLDGEPIGWCDECEWDVFPGEAAEGPDGELLCDECLRRLYGDDDDEDNWEEDPDDEDWWEHDPGVP
jgi:hypothetical protein